MKNNTALFGLKKLRRTYYNVHYNLYFLGAKREKEVIRVMLFQLRICSICSHLPEDAVSSIHPFPSQYAH